MWMLPAFDCMSSLMDPFLPRSSWRPSPFLLQDAHPTSVYRSMHLQTPTAASLVPGTTLHLNPNTAKKKEKIKHRHTQTHTGMPRELSCIHLPPVTQGLLTCCVDTLLIFSTCVNTLRPWRRFLAATSSQKNKNKTMNSWVKKVRIYLNMEFILCCESKNC